MQKRISSNKKYSGQVLAVVLIVLFVGVLIALQMMARTERQGDQVREENFSATALEVADIGLDAVKGIDISEFIIASNGNTAMCNNLRGLDTFFSGGGCKMQTWDNFKEFTATFGLEDYRDEVRTTIEEECNDEVNDITPENSVFSLSVVPMTETDPIEIEKDEVFSIMTLSPNVPATCSVVVHLTGVGGAGTDIGAVLNPIYAKLDADSNISEFQEYSNDNYRGICVGGGDCVTNWGANWLPNGDIANRTYPIMSGGFSMYELRVRAVGGNVRLTREFVGCGDEMYGDMVHVLSDSTCSNTYRGKEFILSREAWAPAIFDYVLFNGQGTLQIQ